MPEPTLHMYNGPESVLAVAINEFKAATLDDINWPAGGKIVFWMTTPLSRSDQEMAKDLIFQHFDSVSDISTPYFPTRDIDLRVVSGATLVTIVGDTSRATKVGPRLVR